jgi:hypothetical protein
MPHKDSLAKLNMMRKIRRVEIGETTKALRIELPESSPNI